jgi:hypothetical protein
LCLLINHKHKHGGVAPFYFVLEKEWLRALESELMRVKKGYSLSLVLWVALRCVLGVCLDALCSWLPSFWLVGCGVEDFKL